MLTIQSPTRVQRPIAVGIDLGTTHSLVAMYRDGNITVLPDETGVCLLPSVDETHTIVSAKRFMGQPNKTWSIGQSSVTPIGVSAQILKKLIMRAQSIDSAIYQAVITVPAYFDETQRQATKRAAELAGIEVLRLLNEPTAAAIAYGLDSSAQGTCLVFDLGGGTFDVSILRLSKGLFEVVATAGDTALGGDDMDHVVMQCLQCPLLKAREVKEALSQQHCVAGLNREQFNDLIEPLVHKMFTLCKQALVDANMTVKDLDEVILVGGATRVPLIQEKVEAFFGKVPLCTKDPDKVVAMGAAIQASILSGATKSDDFLLLDVTPLSLGIEMMGGLVEKIILRNTSIPAVATQTFTTYADGQTGLSLHVVQGEREAVEDCRSLAHFDLNGIPPMPAGKARIEVIFRIDADGLLTVEAKEQISGVSAHVSVQSNYGLTDDVIIDNVEASIAHEKEDRQKRKLRQKTVEANQLIASIEKTLNTHRYLLNDDEFLAINNALAELTNALQQASLKAISEAFVSLEPLANNLAEKQLNEALTQALAGKAVEDLEATLL